MNTKTKEYRDFNELLKIELKDPEFATGYLNEALASGDKKVFLLALRHVIDARGNVKGFAEESDVSRQSIYRMLSQEGNPTWDSLYALLEAMGFKMQVILA
jgi:probable addiction module antidote protein